VIYTICAVPGCWHFIEENGTRDYGIQFAEYVHLDDGEKEHDHDALPGIARSLDVWKLTNPSLFVTYDDEKIGPNSAHFRHFAVPA